MINKKPTLCLDFDGVCHSYTSGWQGPATISDSPVEGLREFLESALEQFSIAIYSSRSHQSGGIPAMIDWFVRMGMEDIVEELYFPDHKPSAHVTIDDRAVTFTGKWPSIDFLVYFRPWNR